MVEKENEGKKYINKYSIAFIMTILCVIMSVIFIMDRTYVNENELKQQDKLITQQVTMEEDLVVEGYVLDDPNVILNPYGNSPLTALVLFQTEEEEQPEIKVKGKDELSTVEGSSELAKDHFVPIYGLYPGEKNEVTITVGQNKTTLIIETEELPEDFHLPIEMYTPNRDKLTNEFYFFTPASEGYTSAYDVNGDVRWYLTETMVWDISRLENGRLLLGTERPINPPYFTTGLYEIDLLGKIYTEFSLPGGYHHDFFELENGNLLIATSDFNGETVEDVVVEVDRDNGDIVKTWDLKDVLNTRDGKSEDWSDYDWFHNNSVWYDDNTNNIILSGRHQDAVIAIDYDNSDLQWIIGDPTGWSDDYQEYFFTPIDGQDDFEWQWSQHSAKVTPEGWISILDNGNNKSKVRDEYVPAEESYTRGVIYSIDENNMTIEQIWQYGKERGSEFYSPYISDFDYLDENHYLVHSGGIVYVDGEISNRPAGFDDNSEMYSNTVEVKDDEVILELVLPTNMYRAEKMGLYESDSGSGESFELGGQSVLGSLGKTIADNKYYGIPYGTNESYDRYEEYEIELNNEEDRIVLNGTFEKRTDVKVILYNDFKMKEYGIRISTRPYTALCLDLFVKEETDNTLSVEKYINKEGLSGDYSIYIQVEDMMYNTGFNVNMDN